MVNGLRILDISDPANPVILNDIYLPGGSTLAIAVSGNRAVVTTLDGLVYVIDVTHPTTSDYNPDWTYQLPRQARDVACTGDLAYVVFADIDDGLGMAFWISLRPRQFAKYRGSISRWGPRISALLIALPS